MTTIGSKDSHACASLHHKYNINKNKYQMVVLNKIAIFSNLPGIQELGASIPQEIPRDATCVKMLNLSCVLYHNMPVQGSSNLVFSHQPKLAKVFAECSSVPQQAAKVSMILVADLHNKCITYCNSLESLILCSARDQAAVCWYSSFPCNLF